MKKILQSLVAVITLTSFVAPVFAEDKPAGEEKPAKKKGKKSKKKAEEAKPAEGAAK